MDKILEVKNLKISFRTNSGILRAVRDISFDLERGETLAIVGESGSGKSVTSKAILGILAGNSIIDGGEVLYDGKELLQLPEAEMFKIRGDKISMIFQDPLSSLNPIVKIGKQITEAMILKNKVNRKQSRKEFNIMLARLKNNINGAVLKDKSATEERVDDMIKTFDRFNIVANKLENEYNTAFTCAEELYADIDDFLFRLAKKQRPDVKALLKGFSNKLLNVRSPFLTSRFDARLSELQTNLLKLSVSYVPAASNESGIILPSSVSEALTGVQNFLKDIMSQTRPNFFRIGYYTMKNPNVDLSMRTADDINDMTLDFLNRDFMNDFIELEVKGVRYSYERALDMKRKAVSSLSAGREYYLNHALEKSEAMKRCNELSDIVESSIDRLETVKDSTAYTFRISLTGAIEKYFKYEKNNPKEEARFAKQSKKRDALIAAGKKVDWKVVPKNVYDLNALRADIVAVLDRVIEKYTSYIENSTNIDFRARGIELIDYFKGKASQVVYRVTKKTAKEKAIKLMEEVGISDPRIRFYQYPFEFSGGMRQRIVIAIALAANPDILICDEPTTALDVTIQAQILELINRLKEERRLSVIFITHDLGVVANMADKIAVMYAGKIVEYGTAEDIFYDPRHPYTWALLSSMPDLTTTEKLEAIPGTPPDLVYPPEGDAFAIRNQYALKIDFEEQPPMFSVSDTHYAATWMLHPNAPKIELPKIVS